MRQRIEDYQLQLHQLREASLDYARVHDAQGPDRNLAWHVLLEAAQAYTRARQAFIDGMKAEGDKSPFTPT